VTAQATDNSGATGTSAAVAVTVAGGTTTDTTPPVRSAGAPGGTLPAGTTQATLSLTTSEAATCRYGTVAGVAYASQASAFTTTGGVSHNAQLAGLADGSTYTFYVRCRDGASNANTDDYAISFSVAAAAAGGLVGHWQFDEGSGTSSTDTSGQGNHAALLNGAGWGTGRSGSALSLDGTNDYASVSDSVSLQAVRGGITVAAWVYRNGKGGWDPVLSRQIGNGYTENFLLGFDNGSCRWLVNTTSGYARLHGAPAPAGQWIHLAGTYDGAVARLYVNGVEQLSAPHSGQMAVPDRPVLIGGNANTATGAATDLFAGRIDDVRLYGRALNAAEIQALYGSAQ